jgi:hypothetical protein
MEKEALNKTLDELKEKSKDYQHQVELRVLDNCPFIVQVGAMTITTDENRRVITQNSNYPTQFTQKAVDEILTMTFKNGNGDVVIPKVYSRVEWYKESLDEITETIKILETNLLEV